MNKKTFRICILANSLSGGGGETVALMLCRAFKQKGLDVRLLCIERNDQLDAAGVDVHYLSRHGGAESGLLKILSLPLFALRLKRFIRDNNIDHVQSHMYRANYTNVLSRLFGAKHSIQIVNHGIAGRYKKLGLLGRVNLALIRCLYPRADQLLCPSTGMMDDLVRCGVPGNIMQLVPNPFQLDDIVAAAKDALPDEYMDRLAGRKVIISVGRLERVKNPVDILQAFRALHEKDNTAILVFVGEGSERSRLETMTREAGLGSSVIFTGYVANPFSYIAHASVLVTASEYEGFSNVIVEALALSVPVVSTDCPGGPREILSAEDEVYDAMATVKQGEVEVKEYGLLVPVGDTESLQYAIERMLAEADLRESFISKSQQRAADYSADTIVKRHIMLMSNL